MLIADYIPFERESVLQGFLFTFLFLIGTVSIPFERESVLQENSFALSLVRLCFVSIPFERESVLQEHPFCTQWGRGSVRQNPNANFARGFLRHKFVSKMRRTLINTDPNAIFLKNRLGRQAPSGFLDNFSR